MSAAKSSSSNTDRQKQMKPGKSGLRKRFDNLKVGQKISLGYTIALGIAVLGSIIGVVIGDNFHQKAIEHEEDANEEFKLIAGLNFELSETHKHFLVFPAILEQPEKLSRNYALFIEHQEKFKEKWKEFKETEGGTGGVEEEEGELEAVQDFLEAYGNIPEAYIEETNKFLREINILDLQAENSEEIKAKLLDFNKKDLILKLDNVSQGLIKLTERLEEEYELAKSYTAAASKLRSRIIFGSILLSVVVAAILAIYITYTISYPLKISTKVAKIVTREANFDLQAPIVTNDEVGILSQSLNELIFKVNKLLKERDIINRSLHEKNIYLEKTLQELQTTQTQLIQSEKMSSLGQLVAGIAHEINNPVSFIHGNLVHATEYIQELLELLALYQDCYPTPSQEIQSQMEAIELGFVVKDLMKLLSSMQVGTERIRDIVLSLRNFSRLDEADFKRVDIHEGIDNTLMILRNRLQATEKRPEVAVIKNYGELPFIECYPGQLNQVFMNLLTNAIDALEESNKGFSYVDIEAEPNTITISTQLLDKQWVRIIIADNGLGINQDVESKLFDPFFTTKPVGKGTGLGLSISYQIVTDKHGGKIYCNSQLGQGTEFVLEIPVKQPSDIISRQLSNNNSRKLKY